MAKKPNYYDITNVLKTNARYIILLGQRANGKSYQAKMTALSNAYKNGRMFIYLRRWREDIKTKAVESYFGDMPIEKITNGEYTGVIAWNGSLYFSNIVDDKIVRGQAIGKYCALNEYERYKSQTFIDYDYILYEEFITNGLYLYDEPRLLQQFVSTVARHKTLTVILIGNTLSRVCPYFKEWALEGVLRQKIGTIDVYHHHSADGTVDIAVEYCANANATNTMFFGQASKQIVSGEWDTQDVPRLPKKQSSYTTLYEIKVIYQSFEFIVELLADTDEGGVLCFIYPFTGSRIIERVLSDSFSGNPLTSSRLNLNHRAEKMISECFRSNKVCYSDNLTGSDFRAVNDNFKLAQMF